MKTDIEIYPHNRLAYEKVCAAFEESSRTCVIHPTGTGKMYVALQLIDANADKAILYLTSYGPILTALETEMEKCGVAADNLTTGLYASLDAAAVEHHYDYIILDEFHRAGAEVWGSWISKLLENNPQAKILGLSATPIRYLDNNRDMSDELFDGNVASSMTLAEAIGNGILKMPKYVCAVYSLSEEFSRCEERVHAMNAGANKTQALTMLEKARRSLEQADGLNDIFSKHIQVKNGHYIVFCRNYEHLESMRSECRSWLDGVNREITIYEVRADRPDATNKQTIAAFDADNSKNLKLLFAVDMLNEGIHASNVDGCIMLRPTESMNVFLQQLGRAISVGSKAQTIVFDIVNNSAQLNAFGNFKSEVERVVAETGSGIELEDFEIHESLRDFYDIVSRIDILLANKSWEEWFFIAKAYYEENGHLLVPYKHKTYDGDNLGVWIATQRQSYKHGTLTSSRIEKLDSIGMVWAINKDDIWDHIYACAKHYLEENGHLTVPRTYKTKNSISLRRWIERQRKALRDGTLSAEQMAKLNDIGITKGDFRQYQYQAWDSMYACAKRYFEENGHLLVPYEYTTQDNKHLGAWISRLRVAHQRGALSVEQQQQLTAIGMVWNALDEKWMKMYIYAKRYFDANGHCRIPRRTKSPDGRSLEAWANKQRVLYQRGTLSEDRITKLNAIGFDWAPMSTRSSCGLRPAKQVVHNQGNLPIPSAHPLSPTKGDTYMQFIILRQEDNSCHIIEKAKSALDALQQYVKVCSSCDTVPFTILCDSGKMKVKDLVAFANQYLLPSYCAIVSIHPLGPNSLEVEAEKTSTEEVGM